MINPHSERWRELCEQVAKEQDPVRFATLVEELLDELKNKETRLKSTEAKGSSSAAD